MGLESLMKIDEAWLEIVRRRNLAVESFLRENDADPSVHELVRVRMDEVPGEPAAYDETLILAPRAEVEGLVVLPIADLIRRYPSARVRCGLRA